MPLATAAAQSITPPAAALVPPEGELKVGDPIQLTLAVNHPANTQVIMPVLAGSESDLDWGDFIVQGQSAPVTVANADGTETTSQTIDVRLFAPGEFTTPTLPVTVVAPDGQVSEITAEPLAVTISSVLVEGDTALRDIKPQAALPYFNLLPWLAVGLILALVAGLIFWLVRRRRARLALAAVDNRLPHEVALDELDRIGGLGLPEAGRFKEHYSLVADCLRLYLERSYQVPMLERTTAEVEKELSRTTIAPVITGHILSLLDISDLVKFAKYIPEVANATGLVNSARQIVIQTKPVAIDPELMPDQNGSNGQTTSRQPSTNGNYQRTEVSA